MISKKERSVISVLSFDFAEKLNKECDVRLPYPAEQDWEFCAGDYKRTGDYIDFYHKHSAEMSYTQKELLANMIVQGIEDYMRCSDDKEHIDLLWSKTREILINDNHSRTIEYWSCIGQELEDCWKITSKMRELPCTKNIG